MKLYKFLSFLLIILSFSIISCEKENNIVPDPNPEPTPDYREKWTGTYGIVDAWTKRYVVSITDETDSMIHISGGGMWEIDRDILLHSDGTFAYRNGTGVYDTTSGFFTLSETPYYEYDSLYIQYPVPGHFMTQGVSHHCYRLPEDLLESK